MECPNYQAVNNEGARFCINCGRPLSSPSCDSPVEYVLADRISRLAAVLLDWLIWLVLSVGSIVIAPKLGFLLGFLALAYLILQAVLLSKDGQTLGKKATRIRVVKVKTGLIGGFVRNVLVRVIGNAVLGIIPFYTLVDILFIYRRDRRCIHDFLAGTSVIKTSPR